MGPDRYVLHPSHPDLLNASCGQRTHIPRRKGYLGSQDVCRGYGTSKILGAGYLLPVARRASPTNWINRLRCNVLQLGDPILFPFPQQSAFDLSPRANWALFANGVDHQPPSLDLSTSVHPPVAPFPASHHPPSSGTSTSMGQSPFKREKLVCSSLYEQQLARSPDTTMMTGIMHK